VIEKSVALWIPYLGMSTAVPIRMNPFLHRLLSVSAVVYRRALGVPSVAGLLTETKEPSATIPDIEAMAETHTAWASPQTRSSIGIAMWRLVIESGIPTVGASIVVEGIDGHGVVKFSTVIRRNPKDKSLYIESCKHSGAFSLAKSSGAYLVSNTINLPQWTKFTSAFKADWAHDKAPTAARAVADIVDMLGRLSSEIPRTQSKARVLGGSYSVGLIAAAMLAQELV
jgi:hypothetical protein